MSKVNDSRWAWLKPVWVSGVALGLVALAAGPKVALIVTGVGVTLLGVGFLALSALPFLFFRGR